MPHQVLEGGESVKGGDAVRGVEQNFNQRLMQICDRFRRFSQPRGQLRGDNHTLQTEARLAPEPRIREYARGIDGARKVSIVIHCSLIPDAR
ncbi:hypothetical protein [Chloracidobacterium aggregatum]|uniref:hypothetical protein n=1 Tax=Chloracidobacterium aggregatum TaxID=2851959 RepID=UPI001B8AAE56|nr:hypothetical protein [Chloracidobacterium aggregatum]QUV87113.1 hypothetical protein J8C07_07900 [Chloracidobacterium sp. S]QUV90015.1 hypothetical protein J8C04_06920 [Chloracidobacterium sp. A]